jgi:hypothetical protein
MSDWQVGDLAVCVDVSDRFYAQYRRTALAGRRFAIGKKYRVVATSIHRITGEEILLMEGQPDTAGAWRFRKIRPDEHEACEEEFVILLKLSKQRVSA